jgi:hypothetical protein
MSSGHGLRHHRLLTAKDLDADHPYIFLVTPRKTKRVKEMSKDFVYGALTLLLAVGLVAALVFFQGQFSV